MATGTKLKNVTPCIKMCNCYHYNKMMRMTDRGIPENIPYQITVKKFHFILEAIKELPN